MTKVLVWGAVLVVVLVALTMGGLEGFNPADVSKLQTLSVADKAKPLSEVQHMPGMEETVKSILTDKTIKPNMSVNEVLAKLK
jgi:hypothetical protein